MPQLDAEQKRIVRLIRQEGRNIRDPKLRRIYLRAAVETGLVESGLRNLSYGDADSQGWRQERASLYKNPTNLKASIRRFREEFLQQYDPGENAGEVAAQVQRPREDLRYKYGERLGDAKQILRQVGAGGPGQSNRAGLPSASPGGYTIPGVDNSQVRQQAMLGYLEERGKPGALLDLKASLDAAQDVPSRRVRVPRNAGVPRGAEQGEKRNGLYGGLKELFWQGQGGINVKDGKLEPQGFVSGHTDHVHVAGRQHDMIRLGKLAQQMGLTVRENPAFDPVDPVHTEGSYHYGKRVGKKRFRALDVSGDPALMRKYAHRVARLYGV